MATRTLQIVIDKAEAESVADEVELLISRLSEFDKGRLSGLFQQLGVAAFLDVQQDNSAAPAGELRITVKPTQRFLRCLVALRAGQIDQCFVEE